MAVFAANWKMNVSPEEVEGLVKPIVDFANGRSDTVILCPPSIYLERLNTLLSGSTLHFGAQNCYFETSGAFTGEISPVMLKALGATYVILGHSERRQIFGETDALIAKKVTAALDNGLKPIICVGETLEQREAGQAFSVVESQISVAVAGNETALKSSGFMIAYEPVWAIGTGKVASPEQAQEVHAGITAQCQALFGDVYVPLLYGGSVKPGNASELLAQADIDGFLVGGASLSADDFNSIIAA